MNIELPGSLSSTLGRGTRLLTPQFESSPRHLMSLSTSDFSSSVDSLYQNALTTSFLAHRHLRTLAQAGLEWFNVFVHHFQVIQGRVTLQA